jgi:hypothetical protein
LANNPSVLSVSLVVNPAEFVFSRNFGPRRPKRSSPQAQPSISDKKTSKAIRACSRANSCAEEPTGNDSKNNLTATSGISLDSAPRSRQNLKKRSKCTLHPYSVLSPTTNPLLSTNRTTHPFGCTPKFSATPPFPAAPTALFRNSFINQTNQPKT